MLSSVRITPATARGAPSSPIDPLVTRSAAGSIGGAFLNPLAAGVATIFMLHRFTDGDEWPGHPIAALREQLAYLRRRRFRLISVAELFAELREPARPWAPTVVFTVDDGYADFAHHAAPVFAEFDCPVTVFLATGFMDRDVWLWWDRIRYAFEHADRTECVVEVGGDSVRYEWSSRAEARDCAGRLATRLERTPDTVLRRVVDELSATLGVDVPPLPTSEYGAMTWEQVRILEHRGVSFGPHTVTHPILSQVTPAALETEVADSWRRLREETMNPVPVFCYPNGQPYAVGDRERGVIAANGLGGAVTAVPRYARRTDGDETLWRYDVPRFSCPDDMRQFRHIVSGLERLKAPMRKVLRR
jgi:peptidoglycan/xylan/chitin deacetylase (PgdA/CDA1 family)